MNGEIKTGLDGKHYMVFKDGIECEKNAPSGVAFHCFGGFENAYLIEVALPMLLSKTKELQRVAYMYEETLSLLRRQLIECEKAEMTGIIDSTLDVNPSNGKTKLDRAKAA